ncbi:MAG: hypothetical protein QOE09_1773 [Ilumatobacteraceae bacterium]|jgi:hypothetical protein
MIDLERSLSDLAERVDIPSSDRFVSDVIRRIDVAPESPVRRASRPVPRLVGALVALVIAVVVVLPGPRHAVARWLGFDSVRIEPGVTVPTTAAPTTVVISTAVPPTNPSLKLGPALSIDAAMSQTGLPDPTPQLLGKPQSLHVVTPPSTGQILLVYAPSDLVPQSSVTGVGALVSVMPAHIDQGFFRKLLGSEASVRPIDFDGARGFWIEGSPHQLLFDVGDGQVLPDTLRLATNTLLWERDGHVYRLEADITLETAVRIATSVA